MLLDARDRVFVSVRGKRHDVFFFPPQTLATRTALPRHNVESAFYGITHVRAQRFIIFFRATRRRALLYRGYGAKKLEIYY